MLTKTSDKGIRFLKQSFIGSTERHYFTSKRKSNTYQISLNGHIRGIKFQYFVPHFEQVSIGIFKACIFQKSYAWSWIWLSATYGFIYINYKITIDKAILKYVIFSWSWKRDTFIFEHNTFTQSPYTQIRGHTGSNSLAQRIWVQNVH